MAKELSGKQYAVNMLKEHGKETSIEMICNVVADLAEGDGANSNFYQINWWMLVLKYIR